MKEPLGMIDERVKMTDTPPNGLLSPSFASVLAFDELLQYSTTDLNDFRTLDFSPRKQPTTDEMGETVDALGDTRRHPRLELDVALDKYHTLDGFAELLNPHNTPASHSGCNSPGEPTGHDNDENLRASSAPISRTLGVDWSDGKNQADLIFFPGDEDDGFKTRKRHSATDPRSSVSMADATKDVQAAADDSIVKKMAIDGASLLRCVRFTPPGKSSRRQYARSAQRPIPSVERKQDYIASHRQHKQHEKWRSPNRARSQRVSAYRSSDMTSQPLTTQFDRQPNIRFSPRARSPSRRDERSRSPSVESRCQEPSGQEGSGVAEASTDNTMSFNKSAIIRQKYDLAAVHFSLYHYRFAETWRFNSLRLRIDSVTFPVTSTPPDVSRREAVIRMTIENLLLHVSFVVPAFILRLSPVTITAAGKPTPTRTSLAAIHIAQTLWSLLTRVIRVIAFMLGLRSGYHWDFTVEYYPHETPLMAGGASSSSERAPGV